MFGKIKCSLNKIGKMTRFSKETCDNNNFTDADERQNFGGNISC